MLQSISNKPLKFEFTVTPNQTTTGRAAFFITKTCFWKFRNNFDFQIVVKRSMACLKGLKSEEEESTIRK